MKRILPAQQEEDTVESLLRHSDQFEGGALTGGLIKKKPKDKTLKAIAANVAQQTGD